MNTPLRANSLNHLYMVLRASVPDAWHIYPRQYVLFGNKWLPSPDPSKRTADLVHTYDKSGHYQKSVLRFPDRFLPLNLIACDTPEVYADSAANTVYIALPFDYKVYSLAPSEKISSIINEKPARFREPATRCDPKAGPEGVKEFQSWLLTWTPIVAIWQDGAYFLIEYQTFDPLRYTVDVRDLHTHRLLAQLGTNYRYLTTDTLGQEWFVRDVDGASYRPELLKGKFDEHAWR